MIADLICHSKDDCGENKMKQRSRVAIGELKKANPQRNKTGHRYNVKEGRHC